MIVKIQVRTVGVEMGPFELDPVVEGWRAKLEELNERAPPGIGKGIMVSSPQFLTSKLDREYMEIAKQGTLYAFIGVAIGLFLAIGNIFIAILASVSMFQVLVIPYGMLVYF